MPPCRTRAGVGGRAVASSAPTTSPAGYSPWRHMALTLALATALATLGVALAVARARRSTGCCCPCFLVIANFIEWMVHRNPMHRPLRPRIMYRNHAQLHHLAFTDGNMVIGRTDRAGPDHDALVHDARAVRRRVAGHGDRGRAARPGAGGRLPAGRRRLLPLLRDAARALPPARRDAGSRRHRPRCAPSGGCRRTTATITSWAGWRRSTSTSPSR